MKKIAGIMLTVLLMLSLVAAEAASYTLPEKMQRQLEFGSGLKGSITLQTEGESPLAQSLALLNGHTLQLRGITSNGDVRYNLYIQGENEQELGLTRFWTNKDATASWFSSALIPDTVLELPLPEDLLPTLMGAGKDANPLWYSAAMNLVSMSEETWKNNMEPDLKGCLDQIEIWLSAYAEAPVLDVLQGGENVLKIEYVIPAQAVKNEIISLLETVLADEFLMKQLKTVTTEDQSQVYLNKDYLHFYREAVNALPLNGEITMSRSLSIMGETLSMDIFLPLPENDKGWLSLAIHEESQKAIYELKGDNKTLYLSVKKSENTTDATSFEGVVEYLKAAEGKESALCAEFALNRSHSNTVDTDTREHDTTTWSLEICPSDVHLSEKTHAEMISFTPINATVKIHFSSKNAQNSPTTLLLTGIGEWQGMKMALDCTFKSASPWMIETLDESGAVSLENRKDEEKHELLQSFIDNALKFLKDHKPVATPEPALTEAPAVTDAPAAENPVETGKPQGEETPETETQPHENEPAPESTEEPPETDSGNEEMEPEEQEPQINPN